MISLITMTQGNPIALKRTIDNVMEQFGGLVDEVLIGDLCVFQSDRDKINNFGLTCKGGPFEVPFNTLFKYGFANNLNTIAEHATNDLCLYMNVSEIVECNINTSIISDTWNAYKFNHATESHQWIRMWKRTQLQWSGRIHEEVVGKKYVSPDLIFQMADTPKDDEDLFYSSVMNDIKELVYFNQYIKLIDEPSERGATNAGWVEYAKRDYDYIKSRMLGKGKRYEAFVTGDLEMYLNNCQDLPGFENNNLIHFQ